MRQTFLIVVSLLLLSTAAHAQLLTPDQLMQEDADGRPLVLPMAEGASLNSWMFGQAYGNTTGAYNFGDLWYRAGQGLHFGLDFAMPCRTPIAAAADGVVAFVDDMGFGSAPHNLILRHDELGLTTLYGHLFSTPLLVEGQTVRQGQIIAESGDPDLTCVGRPHLHYEVRSMDFSETYNPVPLTRANWHVLAAIGPFGFPLFQQNLYNPRQWMTLDDQPDVRFWGQILNRYEAAWPPRFGAQPPGNPPMPRDATALTESEYQRRQIGLDGCCAGPWWHDTDPNRLYVIDGTPGQLAAVFEYEAASGQMSQNVQPAPPPLLSPDGTHAVEPSLGQARVRRLSDAANWVVDTRGNVPALSTDNQLLMWVETDGASVPGQQGPLTNVYVNSLDGASERVVFSGEGVGARWLDASRVLVSTSRERTTTLYVVDANAAESYALGSWYEMRGLQVAPGGARLMFYTRFGQDPATNGVHLIDTAPGATPQQMPWFGAWRWRDANSVYFIPFQPNEDFQRLVYYDLLTGESRVLTDPATTPLLIADGLWDVSADGARIVYQDAKSRGMILLEPVG